MALVPLKGTFLIGGHGQVLRIRGWEQDLATRSRKRNSRSNLLRLARIAPGEELTDRERAEKGCAELDLECRTRVKLHCSQAERKRGLARGAGGWIV